MPPSSPSSSSHTPNHTSSLTPPLDLGSTPEPPEPHTSIMSPAKEEPAPIASASALKITKPNQAGFPFLSLPPEIRNMIYHYIFTPVRDGICLVIFTHLDDHHRIRSSRLKCNACRLDLQHPSCHSWEQPEERWIPALKFTDGYTHSGILRTCHTIFNEVTPTALSHMHLALNFSFYCTDFVTKAMEILLKSMRRSQGAYLSKVTHVSFEYGFEDQPQDHLLEFINRSDVKIGHFELYEQWISSQLNRKAVKRLITILDTLGNKPVTVAWVDRYGGPSYRFERQRVEFNGALETWLAERAAIKVASPDARLPLLRDFLPQDFDSSAD
ncbi:unnamed protein product [Aureobasidium vineae]|uniref:Uncharacterized protein n=1 Tax=Aureobasidium vineae TaxID=2773715 RepID=A0A9N8J8D2_9PEZI|nr:unnamed protein product [Aureobasidium vineae]